MLIIYRKSDGVVVDNQGINNAVPDVPLIMEHVLPKFGGSLGDYETIELDNIEDVEVVNKTYTYEYSIQDGQVVFGDEIVPPEPEPRPPSEIEILKQENITLQIALAETIEKQETDKINNQIALAELVETLIIQGVL